MIDLKTYIKEAIDVENISYKVNTWMASSQDIEREAFNNVLNKYQTTHQLDDSLLDDFMSKTDVRGFLDFINDNVERDSFEDERTAIKHVIQNIPF